MNIHSKLNFKAELITVLQKIVPPPIYKVDEIARNCYFTLSNLKLQLEEGFSKVTPSVCARIIDKIKAKEDQFSEEEMLQDPSE